MIELLATLERLSRDVSKLASVVDAVRTKLVPAEKVHKLAHSIADTYFGSIHQDLAQSEQPREHSTLLKRASPISRARHISEDQRLHTQQRTPLKFGKSRTTPMRCLVSY